MQIIEKTPLEYYKQFSFLPPPTFPPLGSGGISENKDEADDKAGEQENILKVEQRLL
jgi:hypothetical protein